MTISGAFTNGVTIIPIPAKFQTSLGSLETDGVVIDPPPSGASDLTITKTHNPDIAIPGGTVTYTVTVSNVGTGPSSGAVTVTETPPPGLKVTALTGTGWACIVATADLHSRRRARPGGELPTDYRGDQRRQRRGVWGGEQHRRRVRRRRIELVQ